MTLDEFIQSKHGGSGGATTASPASASTQQSSPLDDYIRSKHDPNYVAPTPTESVKAPATYTAASSVINALTGITGKKAEPYTTPERRTAEPVVPTRNERRADQIDTQRTPDNYIPQIGNIDINPANRGRVKNADGSYSTVDSFSVNMDGKEVLLPTVIQQNGKWVHVDEDTAIDHYIKTGENLGKFDTPEEANAYAEKLHNYHENYWAEQDKLPKEPNRIIDTMPFESHKNSDMGLLNAAPAAFMRTVEEEQKKAKEQAQAQFDELSRQIQEYDLALGMADTPEAQAEINAKRDPLVQQRSQLIESNPDIIDKDKSQGKAFWGAINTGNDAALSRITTFLDKTSGIGDLEQEIYYMIGLNTESPIKAFNRKVHEWAEHNQEYYKEQTKGDPTAQAILNYGSQTVAAVPAMLFAFATAGASLPSTAGLEATAYLNSLSGAEQTLYQVSNAVSTMMADPNWQMAFAQEAGSAYESAVSDGMDEADAAVYSMLYGYLSAVVEVGGTSEAAGGLQQYYKDVEQGKISNGLLARAKEIVGEVGEENVQGMLERGLKGLFGQETAVGPWSKNYSPTGNTIIDPKAMTEEAKGAAVVSALLGVPGAVSNINTNAMPESTANNPVAAETQEAVEVPTPTPPVEPATQTSPAQIRSEQTANTTTPSTQSAVETQNNAAPVDAQETVQDTENLRERGGSRTLREDAARNQALRDFKEQHRDLYRQLRNSETLNKALDIMETGYDNALLEVQTAIKNAQDGRKLAPEIVPLSKMVCDQMAEMGNVEGANQIYSDIAAELTYAGQLGQANAILKGVSPTAKAEAFKKTLAKIAKDANTSLTEEEITDYVNRYRAAESDADRDAVMDEAISQIAKQSPTTLREAFTALRYLNMLGNFKTQGRNLIGNTGMYLVTRAKNRIKALEQVAVNAAYNMFTGNDAVEQTNTLFTDPKLYKEAAALFPEDRKATLGEKKYSDVAEKNQAVADKKTIFKWNWKGEADTAFEKAFRAIADAPMWVLEKYRQATGFAMEMGDQIFTKGVYSQVLADYAKAQGYKSLSDIDTDTLNRMRKYAIQQAQEATFRDTNAVSKFASEFDANWDQFGKIGTAARKITQGIVPFRKTPANVGVRMFEYSPLEAFVTAWDTVQLARGKGNVTLNQVLDEAAKTVTGTSIAALGYVMAKSGMFGFKARGKEDDDKLEAFQKDTQSLADYSIIAPDGTSISADWLTPESGAFFVGVAAAEAFEDGAQSDAFLTLLGATSDVALNMSFLSGIQDAMKNITSYNKDMAALPQFLLNSYLNYIGQATTNSLIGQAEQASEQYRQSTYSDPDSIVPSTLQYTVGKASAKIPVWDYNQADYIDAWGRKQDQGSLAGRIVESFFSPAYVNDDRSTPIDSELERLYEATGENVLPSVTSRSYSLNGERLSPEEYEAYQTTLGSRSLALATSLINGRGWDDLTDSQKADAVKEMYSWATAEAKNAVLEMRGKEPVSTKNEDVAKEIMNAGKMTFAEYYKFDDDLDTYSGGGVPSQEELVSFLDEGGYTNPDKIYSAILPNAKTSYAEAKEKMDAAKAQEAEYQSAGWESTEDFKADQAAMAEYKKDAKNEYDTSSMVAISNYIRDANRTDEQKDMLMADSSNAFAKSYAAIREEGDMSPNEVIDLLLAIDATETSTATPGNGSIAQAELKAYYKEHPELDDTLAIIFGVIKPEGDWQTAKNKK